MARLSLTIPDPLYERLEKLRDRVNVSKICAIALTKELDMIEGTMEGNTATLQDRKVERLVQRFLRQREIKELWYHRGKQDGENWAMDKGTLQELRMIGEEWDDSNIQDYDDIDDLDLDEDDYPTVNLRKTLQHWERQDRADNVQTEIRSDPDEESTHWKAYLEGWWHGARDLWLAARPSITER